MAMGSITQRRRNCGKGQRCHPSRSAPDLAAESGAFAGLPLFLNAGHPGQEDLSPPQSEDFLAHSTFTSPAQRPILPVPEIEGEGEAYTSVAYGNSLRLQGRTRASFSNSFATQDVVTEPAEGCEGCRARQCVRVTGTLVSTFSVTTTVTLPSVSDYPNLTSCQQQRVRNAIDNVLAPHEQQHVSAFQGYNGSVSTPFDLTLCRGRFSAEIRGMHNGIESARRSSAQAASDALDPFHFDVNLNCSD